MRGEGGVEKRRGVLGEGEEEEEEKEIDIIGGHRGRRRKRMFK